MYSLQCNVCLCQFSRGSAFGSPVEIPVEDQTVYRSRRQSENAGGEWESTQPAQDRRSHTSLVSHVSTLLSFVYILMRLLTVYIAVFPQVKWMA